MPIFSTCIITYLFTFCELDTGSLYFAHRADEDTLNVYIDGELEHVIYKGKELKND